MIKENDIFFTHRHYVYQGISLQVFILSLTWPWILQQGYAWRPRSLIFSILCKMSHFRPWYIKVNWRIKAFVASKNVNILILQTVLNISTITSLYSYVLSIKCNIRRKKQICILKVFSVIRKFWLLLLSIWRPWCHGVFNHLSLEVNLDREHYVLQIMH